MLFGDLPDGWRSALKLACACPLEGLDLSQQSETAPATPRRYEADQGSSFIRTSIKDHDCLLHLLEQLIGHRLEPAYNPFGVA
jgi:hypothetical protein